MTQEQLPEAEAASSRRVALIAGVVLVAALVSGFALHRSGKDPEAADLTVEWGGSEGVPSCAYDPEGDTVEAKVKIEGEAPDDGEVTVTVTAYADENTSQPVGSSSRTVQVEGTVDLLVLVTIPVEKPPHVGEDDETACRLSVDY